VFIFLNKGVTPLPKITGFIPVNTNEVFMPVQELLQYSLNPVTHEEITARYEAISTLGDCHENPFDVLYT
jgi:hypothetical protein